jgi:hypothetical protein
MGWLFLYEKRSRKEMLEHLRRPERYGQDNELLRSVAVGNNHWYLCKHKSTDKVWIGLDLMKGSRADRCWGYKDIDESMGPCEVNCPLSFLDKASEPEGYAIEWRQKVREYHAKKAARVAPVAGLVVQYGEHQYRLVEPYAPRKGWLVTRVSDGARFRMPARHLAQSKPVPALKEAA